MKKNKNGFTLMELLIGISIIGIVIIGINQLNFNTISDKQRAETYLNKIITSIETVKNNALIGKGIGADLIVPKEWKIDLRIGSGSLISSYFSGAWNNYNDYSFFPENEQYKIKSIECADLNNNTGSLDGNTGSIIISGSNLSLSGCTDNIYKILRITSSYKQFENTFELNTISGVIKNK